MGLGVCVCVCVHVCVCYLTLWGSCRRLEMDERGAAFLNPFNSIRLDLLACTEDPLLAYAKRAARNMA